MKQLLATIVGFVVAAGTILLFEFFGEMFYPIPEFINTNDLDALKAFIDKIPIGNLIFVAAAHFLGITAGMLITTYVTKSSLIPGYIVGIAMLIATIINLFIIPHPVWFYFLDVAAAVLGFILGHFLSRKRISTKGF